MLVLAPLAAFALLFLAFLGRGIAARPAFLHAATAWGVAVVAFTEGLGAVHLLTRGALFVAWAALALAVAALDRRALALGARRVRAWRLELPLELSRLGRFDRALLAGIALVGAIVAVVGIACPPNVWDVMEYHLPRVVMWLSNRSVSFYPTPNYCQLVHAPFAEFAMLHLDVLWGGDRAANFVDFFGLFGCTVGASWLAALLGAGRRGQLLAAVACVTIPESVLEASGAMNTCVVSFWLLVTVAFIRAYRDRPTWLEAATVGAAAGLSLLTKGVAWAFLPTLALAFLFMLPPASLLSLLRRGPGMAALGAVLNLPQALRARDLTGHLLGAPFADGGPWLTYPVEHKTFAGFIANCLRNFSLHLSVHNGRLTQTFEHLIRAAIRAIGQDPDDPGAVFLGSSYGAIAHFSIPAYARSEIVTGNLVTLLLMLAAMGWAFWRWRRAGRRDPWLCSAGILAGFAFFCLMLRWQVWSSRFQLPLFVVAAAPIGLFLEERSVRAQAVVALLLIGWAASIAMANDTRSLVPSPPGKMPDVYHPRDELYFSDGHRAIMKGQIDLARAANQTSCSDVAFDSYSSRPAAELTEGPDSFFIYPLMALTGSGTERRAWYEGVQNLSIKYVEASPHPPACMVICLDCAQVPDKMSAYARRGLHPQVFGRDVLFSP
jgi:hypothetical protein